MGQALRPETGQDRRMITIIGTAHIQDLKEKVRNRIRENKPRAVCLELRPNMVVNLGIGMPEERY